MPVLTESQLAIAVDWLLDCFPDDVDEIEDCDSETICRVVNYYYDGGIVEFCRTNPDCE